MLRALPACRALILLWGGLGLLDLTGELSVVVRGLLVIGLLVVVTRGLGRRDVLALGAIAWLLVTGFVTHRFGQLLPLGAADGLSAGLIFLVCLGRPSW